MTYSPGLKGRLTLRSLGKTEERSEKNQVARDEDDPEEDPHSLVRLRIDHAGARKARPKGSVQSHRQDRQECHERKGLPS